MLRLFIYIGLAFDFHFFSELQISCLASYAFGATFGYKSFVSTEGAST